MKKFDLKSIIIGLLLGGLILGPFTTYAAVKTYTLTQPKYKVTLNKKAYANTKAQVLSYNSTVAVVLDNDMQDKLNIDVTQDNKNQTIDITPETPAPEIKEILYYSDNGIEFVEIDGVKFIAIINAVMNGYTYEIENNTLNMFKSKNDEYNNKPAFSNVPFSKVKKDVYIDYNFYVNNLSESLEPVKQEENKMEEALQTTAPTQAKIDPMGKINEITINDNNLKPIIKDGFSVFDVSGQEYIAMTTVDKTGIVGFDSKYLIPNKNYRITFSGEYFSLFNMETKEKILQIPAYDKKYIMNINSNFCIEYTYFQNTILPLLK